MIIDKDRHAELVAAKVHQLKQTNRRTFFDALDSREKTKILIWDQDILKLFAQIATFSDLKNDHGVVDMLTLQKAPKIDFQRYAGSKIDHVIYICRPKLNKVEIIIDNIAQFNSTTTTSRQKLLKSTDTFGKNHPNLHIFFLPRSSTFCESKLEENGVLKRLSSLVDLPIYCFGWDDDVLNLEIENDYRDLLLDNEAASCLYDCAVALSQIETLFGPFGEHICKGDHAKRVFELLQKLTPKHEQNERQRKRKHFSIDRILILDRSIDLITPLITQLTYEGLIDENFGIKYGKCAIPTAKFVETTEPSSSKESGDDKFFREFIMNSSDELYTELRDLNFNAVGVTLSKKVKQLAEIRTQIKSANTVRECKELIKRIPLLKSVEASAANHIDVAEILKSQTTKLEFLDTVHCEQEILNMIDTDRVLPFIEEMITKGEHMEKVLRLLCLQSLVNDGIKKKTLDQYRREFCQAYGYQHLNLLANLQKADLLKANGTVNRHTNRDHSINYDQIKTSMRLIVDQVNEQDPEDIAYVYSGLAPMMVRLCQNLQKSSNEESILDALKKIPGASLYHTDPNYEGNKIGEKTICLVVFVGGVTFAEISALRYLSSANENNFYLVLTTGIINGTDIVKNFAK